MQIEQRHRFNCVSAHAHLGGLEHAQIGVHVHGALLLPRALVQLGGVAELALVRAHVAEEHVVVVLPAFLPLLASTKNRKRSVRYAQAKFALILRCEKVPFKQQHSFFCANYNAKTAQFWGRMQKRTTGHDVRTKMTQIQTVQLKS